MARRERQKEKILFLRELLLRETDEDHPLSMPAILERLERMGIQAGRQSIYRDLQCLMDNGMDLIYTPGRGYYVASRTFELAELKLLVDAVQSSKFLSEKKSLKLIDKLGQLTSVHEAGKLRRQVVVSGRVKTRNESVYYNVDRLHEAIAKNNSVVFRYFDWAVNGERRFRPGFREASPYALCWAEENYYLIAGTERHGITHYRVDKMMDIRLTGQPRMVTEESRKLDLGAYSRAVFSMFSGEVRQVRMRFSNTLSGVVIDRFGKGSMLIPDGPDYFTFIADVAVSPTFLGWISSFGPKAQILQPADVVEQYRTLLRETLAQYEDRADEN